MNSTKETVINKIEMGEKNKRPILLRRTRKFIPKTKISQRRTIKR